MKSIYPNNYLLGGEYLSNLSEKYAILEYLNLNWKDIDSEILPYLLILNGSDKIVTIFSCIGHDNDLSSGQLLFRSFLSLEETFSKILIPLQKEYHFNCDLTIGTWLWYDNLNNPKIGYLIEGFPKFENKEIFLKKLCDLVYKA